MSGQTCRGCGKEIDPDSLYAISDGCCAACINGDTPAPKAVPAALLDDLAAQLEASGWTVDYHADSTLRVSRDYPDEYFRQRLIVSDQNQLIPATIYMIEEGYDEDGSDAYACGPTLMDDTLDALVLLQRFRDIHRAQR